MRLIPSFLVAITLAAISCLAQEKLEMDEANTARTYTPVQFQKQLSVDARDGTLIRIKFNGRLADITAGANDSKTGTVIAREGNNFYYTGNSSELNVQIPPAGLAWFQHVAIFRYSEYDKLAVKSYVAYGRIKLNKDGAPTVRLIGTEVQHDLDGDSIVWK